MKKRILILCTGNSCRSQMAEGFLKAFDQELQVFSAGTAPSDRVHPIAIQVMQEKDIDISKAVPKSTDQFLDQSFDVVITVCDHAKETCPVFVGDVQQQIHIGFEDPADAEGSEKEKLAVFRKVRDEIERDFRLFYNQLKDKS